jgi:hypothetical protein
VELVTTVALASKRLDFFFHNLGGQKTGHLRVVPEQVQLHLDRLIQQAFERRYWWQLFWTRAMFGIHERGSFLGDDSS